VDNGRAPPAALFLTALALQLVVSVIQRPLAPARCDRYLAWPTFAYPVHNIKRLPGENRSTPFSQHVMLEATPPAALMLADATGGGYGTSPPCQAQGMQSPIMMVVRQLVTAEQHAGPSCRARIRRAPSRRCTRSHPRRAVNGRRLRLGRCTLTRGPRARPPPGLSCCRQLLAHGPAGVERRAPAAGLTPRDRGMRAAARNQGGVRTGGACRLAGPRH
jgi:hypothetical protein